MFTKYPKIHRLGKEETEGILEGVCSVQEKIDGANTQIWKDESGEIRMGSRSQEIKEGFNGFIDYVKENESIKKLLEEHPEFHLYGEWLVKHSITYHELAYRKWYMFDIFDKNKNRWLNTEEVNHITDTYGIFRPKYFGVFVNPTIEELKEMVGVSDLGKDGEGIVIKNRAFINKFGDNECAKIVTEKFKELNGVVFGGNNKHSDTYWEMWVVNKFMTLSRVQKIINKLQPTIDRRLDMQHLPMIMGACYHDMLTEEIWDIQKKAKKIDFTALQRISYAKAKQIFIDIINDSISVADRKN
ncbi:MAG TPA: RNA ligase family protein [Candidatus Pelethenecus sp.]|nr:RNA ligase family protein [Candidatus Pelethenecus sp.]